MNIKNRNSERGQAIVYLAIGMVVFLGFVALAIDGGMVLADRRNTQNASDAASLAGGAQTAVTLQSEGIDYGNWNCSVVAHAINVGEATAISRAAANDFTIHRQVGASDLYNQVNAQCKSTTYRTNEGTIWFVDKFIDVTTEISATTQSNFLQILYPKALHNEVDSVTRVRPPQPIVFGNAIVALNPEGCSGHNNGGIVYGDSDIKLTGGGIFSNGCLRGNGNPDVYIDGGLPLGNDLEEGQANWYPEPQEVEFQIPTSNYNIDEPNCDDSRANKITADELSDQLKDGPVTLDGGLWCITGDLKINNNEVLHGEGVTLYMVNGGVHVNGHAEVQLSAPSDTPDPYPAIAGLLIYLPINNTISLKLNGTSESFYAGLILAPRSTIVMNGTGYNTYRGQVVGWNVELGGTADTFVDYVPDEGYQEPTSIELSK